MKYKEFNQRWYKVALANQRPGKPLYTGRGYEMEFFDDTGFFHQVTCYIDNPVIRFRVLFEYACGEPFKHIITKWHKYIEHDALMRIIRNNKDTW